MATETTKKVKEDNKKTKEKEISSETKKIEKATTKPKVNSKKKSEAKSLFAVIKTGGKQYLVEEGDTLKVEKIKSLKEGDSKIIFDEVLLINDSGKVKIGTPTISGSKVSAELVEVSRDKKVVVIRYKAKSRYFKKNGHRQPKMTVRITSIK